MSSEHPYFVAACFDLQQVLQCPYGEVNMFYYKRKLTVYNLSIYTLGTQDGNCYMWDETIAKRRSCDIGSCLLKYLKYQIGKGKTDVCLYSDNCGGQNRNKFIVTLYVYITSINPGLTSVKHSFLEKGHTQNENDSIHSTIEGERKRSNFIYCPSQYYSLARCARKTKKSYVVTEMENDDFFDFKMSSKQLKNFTVDETGRKVQWGKIRQILIDRNRPHIMQFKYNHCESRYLELNFFRRCRKKVFPALSLNPLYDEPLPISRAKYDDLLFLCNSGFIPRSYHSFFRNLAHELSKNNDNVDESDEYSLSQYSDDDADWTNYSTQ